MKNHRFDSLQRPLGRFVLFFDAVVELAVQLAMSRTGRPQEDAINFLDYIDEEKCIQLAMLADAADETTLHWCGTQIQKRMTQLSCICRSPVSSGVWTSCSVKGT